MLHLIFQRHHIPPDEVYAKPFRHRMFMYASMLLEIEPELKAAERARKEQAARLKAINAEGR